MKVKKEYAGLTREQLLEKAYQKGHDYLVNSGACAASTVAALHDIVGCDPLLVKVATALSGGTAEQFLGSCGVLTGGILVLGYYNGRPLEKMSDKERIQENVDASQVPYASAMKLTDKFVAKYGTFICNQIHRQKLGRIFYPFEKDESVKFGAAGGPKLAAEIVGNGICWVLEVMLDEGILEL